MPTVILLNSCWVPVGSKFAVTCWLCSTGAEREEVACPSILLWHSGDALPTKFRAMSTLQFPCWGFV